MEKREGKERQNKRRRKKKSLQGRSISMGLDPPCWLCRGSQLLDAIKG
jgi:hypothetical protein